MRDKAILDVVTKAGELGDASGNLVNTLGQINGTDEQPFDLNKIITGRDSSTAQIVGRIETAIGLIAEYNKAQRADMVPFKVISDLEAAITQTISAIEGIITLVGNLTTAQGGIRSFNHSNFHFHDQRQQP